MRLKNLDWHHIKYDPATGDFTFHANEDPTEDWFINGNLKWDGCINWQTNPTCMAHGCGPQHAQDLADLFTALYRLAGL